MSQVQPMQVLMLAGFPGSGKTTLLLRLVESLAQGGRRRVAVIENEVGKIGVDDQYLQSQGLQMRRILGGCVCCTLQGDLITTVRALKQNYDPQVLVVEPSGVAGPQMVKQVFADPLMGPTRPCMVMLVDAKRFPAMKAVLGPFLTQGLEAANLLAINKIDQVDEVALSRISGELRQLSPLAELIPIVAKEGVNVELLLQQVEQVWADSWGFMGNLPEPSDMPLPLAQPGSHSHDHDHHHCGHDHHHDHHHHGPEAVVLAKQLPIEFSPAQAAGDMVKRVSDLLMRLTADLTGAGCPLIGHVKAIVQDGQGGTMLLRTTAAQQEPDRLGKLAPQLRQMTLTLNVIVYGLDRNTVWEIFRVAMSEYHFSPPESPEPPEPPTAPK